MRITEINDLPFKQALFFGVTKPDPTRRFNNHSTDLIYCMVKAFGRKIFAVPQEYTEAGYSTILRWMHGKGMQIGVTNALNIEGEILVLYNPDDPESTGSVDFEFQGDDYELKTTLYGYTVSRRPLPYMTAVLQLMQYLAGRGKRRGKIKLFYLRRYFDRTLKRYFINPEERTWLLEMTEADLIHRRNVMKRNDALLTQALLTGNWRALPTSNFEWECRECIICGMLQVYEEEGILAEAHAQYLIDRKEFYERKDQDRRNSEKATG